MSDVFERVKQIISNQKTFGVGNLQVLCGTAPACLEGLPAPDRVFVGGGGRHLISILAAVRERLAPDGRLLISATLLASLQTATDFIRARGGELEICQVQVSCSRPLAGSLYLQARNPVWILSATFPEGTV